MRVLVATSARCPGHPRLLQRYVCPLLDAGHAVVYAAPFTATGTLPPPGIVPVDLPSGTGATRLGDLRETRRLLTEHSAGADLLVVHDRALLLALPARRPATVWDLPDEHGSAGGAALVSEGLGRWAERRMHVLLAAEEDRSRFRLPHPVAPSCPRAYVAQLERWVRAA